MSLSAADTKRTPIAGYTFGRFSIPDYMADGLALWLDEGIYPGSFLTAVLENNLREAIGRADGNNIRNLPAYVAYLCNEAPRGCWGSATACREWCEAKIKARAALAAAEGKT